MTPIQLKAWRKKRRLSQAALARLLHMTTHAVYQWESGKRRVPAYLDTLFPVLSVGQIAQARTKRKRRGVQQPA